MAGATSEDGEGKSGDVDIKYLQFRCAVLVMRHGGEARASFVMRAVLDSALLKKNCRRIS